jgi:cell filamentation protein, protein adenylyltransferase
MSLYWPAFDFHYLLDVPRLLPHIAAIEAQQEAASTRVLPPPWRERPALGDTEVSQPDSLASQPPSQDEIRIRKEQLLIRNGGRAQAWVRQRFVPSSAPLLLADVLTMHRMVAEESGVRYLNPGALRNSGFVVTVGRQEVGGIHVGAPDPRLPGLMDRYIQFVNGQTLLSLPAVIHALVAHFFFTTIHPFDDGNGRVSRLVSAGILFQRGYNGHGFYALQNYFYQNDIRYHTLLHQCWRQPLPFDLTAFVAFGMEGLATELQGISNFVKVKLHRAVDREMPEQADDKRTHGRRRLPSLC